MMTERFIAQSRKSDKSLQTATSNLSKWVGTVGSTDSEHSGFCCVLSVSLYL